MILLNNLTLSQEAEGRVDWRGEVARDSASRDLLGPQENNTMRNGSCSIGRVSEGQHTFQKEFENGVALIFSPFSVTLVLMTIRHECSNLVTL
jgi:hypothetical protein